MKEGCRHTHKSVAIQNVHRFHRCLVMAIGSTNLKTTMGGASAREYHVFVLHLV
jgi:hypothetical protein